MTCIQEEEEVTLVVPTTRRLTLGDRPNGSRSGLVHPPIGRQSCTVVGRVSAKAQTVSVSCVIF